MNAIQEALTKARARIDTPEKWTRGAFARDASGMPLWAGPHSKAVCFCMAGAVHAAAERGPVSNRCIEALAIAIHERTNGATNNIAEYNDGIASTHADIMSLFDRAIELAGEG